jgi:hypothetical protein
MSRESPPSSDLILYQTEDGRTRIQCRFENETVWLTQKLMAELFQKDVRTINEHIQNVFEEGELSPESVIRKFRITAADGKTYETQHYNLEVIISVGYLREGEIEELNRLVVMFLDFAEDQARRRKQIFLQNWLTRLHDFLNLNERAILPDSGKVNREEAHRQAEEEYARFAARRRAALEAQGEADLLGQIEAQVNKLPKPRKPKGGPK